jgi:hypothetical protein
VTGGQMKYVENKISQKRSKEVKLREVVKEIRKLPYRFSTDMTVV